MSSMRATSLGVMRSPKPPCWRDFVLSTPKSTNSDVVDITEHSGRKFGARSPVPELVETSRVAVSLPGNKPSRLVRRPRARIHRTRSEHVIHAEDLPDSGFTATLATTDPKGLRGRVPEGRLYVEENNRRCQNWLASIEAAEPLDKVDYTTDQQSTSLSNDNKAPDVLAENQSSMVTENKQTDRFRQTENCLIPLYEQQQEVDVEVPEETFVWSTGRSPRHQSPISGEELCSPCREIPRREGSHKHSGNHQRHRSVSPVLISRGSLDNAPQNRPCSEYPKCEGSSDKCSAKMLKCGKMSCGKKFYKLCCDQKDTGSSSWRENDCFGYPADTEGDTKIQMARAHIQEGDYSQISSKAPASARRIRSSSRPSSSPKFPTDSELPILKQ